MLGHDKKERKINRKKHYDNYISVFIHRTGSKNKQQNNKKKTSYKSTS